MSDIADRRVLFNELYEHRQRDLITIVTSTKKPENLFAAQIASDLLPVFYNLLKGKPGDGNLDLLIYSAGGQIDAPWPLINLIREYYSNIYAIVPSRALSAGTLVTLGANTIGMSPMGALSPIDPQLQVKHEGKKEVVVAGVEDIYGYYELLKDILELNDAGRAEGLRILSNRIHPEILGKVARTRREIRIVATNLLNLHMHNEEIVSNIVNHLVEELPSHQYIINRKEALRIGLQVEGLDEETEKISSKIMNSYIDEIGMEELGLAVDFGPSDATKIVELRRAYVETQSRSFAFITRYTFHKDGKVEQAVNRWTEVNN